MVPAAACDESLVGSGGLRGPSAGDEVAPDTVALYDLYIDFVWRSLGRLGVASPDLEDAAQDVFVVVHRRVDSFERRGSIKSWIFGIALRVAKVYRQRGQRRRAQLTTDESLLACTGGSPEEISGRMQAAKRLQALLEQLDEDKRAVFVLAELEHMSAPDIAVALGIPTNTVYSRLRLARAAFENGLKRLNAKDDWRHR